MRILVVEAAVLVLSASCTYEYRNPAEQLSAGQVLGRVVADVSGGGQVSPLPGVGVALENSGLDQVTRATGRFTLLGLPAGRHTLLFRRGTTWALQRQVEIAYGPDGQPEGVSVGDVRLRYMVTLQGTFSLPPPPPNNTFTPAFFAVEDEVTGARAALASVPGGVAYVLAGLPVGPHRVQLGVTGTLFDSVLLTTTPVSYLGGPVAIDVPESSEGQALTLNPVALRAAAASDGKLRFRLAAVSGASFDPQGAVVTLTPTPPVGTNLSPDSTGLVDADLPEGVYVLSVAPAGGAGGTLQPPPPRTLVVQAGKVTQLGTLYAVEDALAQGSRGACLADEDCAPGTCSAGLCVGWVEPVLAPAGVPFCAPAAEAAACQGRCTRCPGGFGTCFDWSGGPVCVPDGGVECTPDGFTVVAQSC